jgi:solute carrier family 25 carnitine/acylcarnitine transporter 20/29
MYEAYREIRSKTSYTVLDGLENGAFAGLAMTLITTPMELVKCIMQGGNSKNYKSSPECMRALFQVRGIRGIYKGNVASIMRDIPGYAAAFAVY